MVTKDGRGSDDFIVDELQRDRLRPGEAMDLIVRFAPRAHGLRTARLRIASEDESASPFDVAMSGEGQSLTVTSQGSDTDEPIQLGDFHAGISAERTFTVRNHGNEAITGLSLEVIGLGRDQISFSHLPSVLEAGEGATVTMRFTATMEGVDQLKVVLHSTSAGEYPTYIELRVRVLVPKLRVRRGKGESLQPTRQVAAWGYGGFGQIAIPTMVGEPVAVAAGHLHSVILEDTGRVVVFGNRNYAQTQVPTGMKKVMAISAGMYHTLALQEDGTVVSWGGYGTGAHGTDYWFQQSYVPSNLDRVVAIAAGWLHSVAVKEDGTVVTWGADGAKPPVGLSDVVSVAAGWGFTVALRRDGTVVAWGSNTGVKNVPQGLSGVVGVAAGWSHAVALKSDGTVVGWGSNSNSVGQIGWPPELGKVREIVAGGNSTALIFRDGTYEIFGRRYASLSNGVFVRDEIPSFRNVETLSLGDEHGLIVGVHDETLPFVTEVPFQSMELGGYRDVELSVINVGSLPLQIATIQIDGRDADQFSIDERAIVSLAMGISAPMTIRFSPTRVGSLEAQVKITSNDPETPVFIIGLSGAGTFSLDATKPSVANSALTYSPPVTDSATGLLLQKLTFVNRTGLTLNGLRLFISNLAAGVTVRSSSAGDVAGTVEVLYGKSIAPGETVTMTLSYADPKRRVGLQPSIRAESLAELEPRSGPVTGTLVPLLNVRDTTNGPFLEWTAMRGAVDVVEYSDDSGNTWFSAVHRLTTTGTRMIWVDRGQPETYTRPANKAARQYRVRRM